MRFGRVAVTLLALGALTLTAPAAAAAAPGAGASTDPTGAHVRLGRAGVWIEVRAPGATNGAGGGSSGATTGCQRRWVATEYPNYLRTGGVDPDYHVTPMPAAPGPEYVAYHVFCDTDYVTSVWLAPNAFTGGAPVVDLRAIAEQLARDLPYPAATVHVSPDGRGLAGLEAWFWVDGYRGPLHDAVDGLGYRVEVEANPAVVRWDFGDDTPVQAGSLGRAAPRRSDVVHTYERSSTSTPMRIGVSIRLDVRYRVNGEPWQALDPVFRSATRAYPVAQSRAALVAPR